MKKLDLGNSGAWERDKLAESFFRQFMAVQKRIYCFILSSVPNASVADDIMQETVTVMWIKFGEFEQGTNFAAWGISIAKYMVLYYYRKERNSFIPFNVEMLETIADRAIEKSSDDLDIRLDALKQCIQKLPERDRKVIELRYDRGMKAKKVAEQLGRSLGGFYKTIARIQNLLLLCVQRELTVEDYV